MNMRIHYNSPVVLTFSIIATVVFGINYLIDQQLTPLFSVSPIFDFKAVSDYLSLFLYVLGHANIDHLLGNMALLLLIGPILEEKYGSKALLFMIISTAVVTGIVNIIIFNTGLWGASGIVFMFIILVSFTNAKKGGIPLTFILILLLYVGREVVSSLQEDNISQFAHILGGIIGSLFGFVVKTKQDKVPAQPQHSEETTTPH